MIQVLDGATAIEGSSFPGLVCMDRRIRCGQLHFDDQGVTHAGKCFQQDFPISVYHQGRGGVRHDGELHGHRATKIQMEARRAGRGYDGSGLLIIQGVHHLSHGDNRGLLKGNPFVIVIPVHHRTSSLMLHHALIRSYFLRGKKKGLCLGSAGWIDWNVNSSNIRARHEENARELSL
ncbi:unnamed protein product [Ectocarpus sp. 8 AP-2014]